MNLGGLVRIAGGGPPDRYHIVLDNGMYAMTGGQPLPNSENIGRTGLARAAGYARTFDLAHRDEF